MRLERWVATDSSSTWRSITDDPANGGQIEQAEGPSTVSSYDASGNVVYERTKPGTWKCLDHSTATDDVNAVSRALAGGANDRGQTSVDGQTVERFDFGSRESNGQACSYYATLQDLRPVALDCTNLLGHPWLSSHTIYEWLDPTPANNALLSLEAQHPSAQVDRAPLGECVMGQKYFGPTRSAVQGSHQAAPRRPRSTSQTATKGAPFRATPEDHPRAHTVRTPTRASASPGGNPRGRSCARIAWI
jgi:hypothetical protein